jgi:hypothetical protein
MGSALSDGRLNAVETAARLKESTNLKVMEIALAKKVHIVVRHERVNHITSCGGAKGTS